jgi:soluble lytic murein transglycosylase-like protein
MRRLLLLLAVVLTLPAAARADIAVLSNGTTLKVGAHRQEADQVVLALKDGGEVTLPASEIRGLVPDEVIEEVASASASGDLRELAAASARRHGLDPELVLAVVAVESGFQPQAVSRKGAQGLMQLMPATAKELGVKDALDPAENLDGGSRYLKDLIALYGGDVKKALAAYNAGPGAVARHGGIPPYKETRRYVREVLKRSGAKTADASR